MAIVNKPDMNYGVWAEGGNIEIPSSEKVEEGWVVEKPLNETMNWLQNRQDRMLQYINERGIPEWDSRTQYPLDAFVARSGVIYKAVSTNTDNDPTLHTNIWQIAFVSYSDFVDYTDKIDSIENVDGYLGLYVSKSNPVMDAPSKGVSYNNKTSDTGLSFIEDVAVINKQGFSVAEFSGGNNPKDVVTHEQLALAIQNYKVGDIYITVGEGDPRVRLGYGVWQRFAEGRTIVGFTTSVSSTLPEWTKVIERQFGEYDHKLTIDELARHNHPIQDGGNPEAGRGGQVETGNNVPYLVGSQSVGYTGGDQPHNNVQPSIVVYFWKRTA